MLQKNHKPFFLDKLQEHFKNKKEKNKHYSLRQYAQFLGVHSGTLSSILSGKRTIPSNKIDLIAKKLNLSDNDCKKFLKSISLAQKTKGHFCEVSPDNHARLYEDLDYFIVLSLFKKSGFKAKRPLVSQLTGIYTEKLEKILSELLFLGFLQASEDGHIQRASKKIYIIHEGTSLCLRQDHRNNLNKTAEIFEKLALEEYDYSHTTLYLDKEAFEALKKDVRQVRDRLDDKKHSENNGKLYRVSLQIFPVVKN